MNVRELRIGNYVMVDGKIVKVNGITRRKIGFCSGRERYARAGDVEPVPITKDIADRCEVYLSLDNGKYGVLVGNGFMDVENLHTLQNLYFMEHNRELNVNL